MKKQLFQTIFGFALIAILLTDCNRVKVVNEYSVLFDETSIRYSVKKYSNGISDVILDEAVVFSTDADTLTALCLDLSKFEYEFRDRTLLDNTDKSYLQLFMARKDTISWVYRIDGTELIPESKCYDDVKWQYLIVSFGNKNAFYFTTFKDGLQGIVDASGDVLFEPDYYQDIEIRTSYDDESYDNYHNGEAKHAPILYCHCTSTHKEVGICDIHGNVLMHPKPNIQWCKPIYDYYDGENHLIGFCVGKCNEYGVLNEYGIVGLYDDIIVPIIYPDNIQHSIAYHDGISWQYGLNHSVYWMGSSDDGRTTLYSQNGEIIYTAAPKERINVRSTDIRKEWHEGNYEWIVVDKDGPELSTLMKVLDIKGNLLYNWQQYENIVYRSGKLLAAELAFDPVRIIRTYPLKTTATRQSSSFSQSCSLCWGNKVCSFCHGQLMFYGVPCASCGGSGICPACNGTGVNLYQQPSPSWDQIYYGNGGGGSVQSSYGTDNYGNSSSTSGSSVSSCSRCHGSGRIAIETFPPMFGLEDYKVRCNECGQSFFKSWGHSHITCPVCHGR